MATQAKAAATDLRTNGSVSTIFALVNSMIGGTMLTLPLLFRDSGIITSFIVLVISGLISRKTCDIYIAHLTEEDHDIQDSIKRILKGRWYEFFCLITGVYLIMLNVLYIVLINDQLYNIIDFVLELSNKSGVLAPKSQFTFSSISLQWLAVFTFLPLFLMLLIKNLSLIVKLTAIGVWSVFVYFAFVAYVFIDNFKQINLSEIKLFSWDIGNLAGTAALAFTIHTVVAPIMKVNKNQKHNSRDLAVSYVMGTVIYAFIGVCGCMAIYNKPKCIHGAQTIIDCFPSNQWQPLVVSIMYLMGLVTVFPCFMDVSRQRLFKAFTPNPISDKARNIFNLGFLAVAFAFEILAPYIKLSDIMNFNGAIFCFFFVYLIPIALHMKCFYGSDNARLSLLTDGSSLLGEGHKQVHGSCGHDPKDISYLPKSIRYLTYTVLIIIGLATMIYGVYSSIMIFM